MQVCDVCLGVPEYNGNPVIATNTRGTDEYLFGDKTDYSAHKMDLCKTCREHFRNRQWDKIAERAHDVLMMRLGVTDKS